MEALLIQAHERLDYVSLDEIGKAALGRAMNMIRFFIYQDPLLVSTNREERLKQAVYLDSRDIFQYLGEAYQLDYAVACYYRANSIDDILACHEQFRGINAKFWVAECDKDLAPLFPQEDEKAAIYAQENLDIRLEIGDLDGQAYALVILGEVEWAQGHIERYASLTQKGIDCFQNIGNQHFVAYIHRRIVGFHNIFGDFQEANRHTEAMETIALELNDPWSLFSVPICRAMIAMNTGQYDQAIQYGQAAIEAGQRFPIEVKTTLFFILFRTYLLRGELSQALTYLKIFFTQEYFWKDLHSSYFTVINLALWSARNSRLRKAATWLGVLDQLIEKNPWFFHHFSPSDRKEMEQTRSTAHTGLGQETFQAACEVGRAMTVEQVIQMAQDMLS